MNECDGSSFDYATGYCTCPGCNVRAVTGPLRQLVSFVSVMVGSGPDSIIPETIRTPLGVDVKIGGIMREARAVLAP